MAGGEAPVPCPDQVIDGLPLISAAEDIKGQANALFSAKKYNEANGLYEKGIAFLDKADGHPMLRDEVEQMIKLKAVLYGNMTQCLLNLELWRRAVDVANKCMELDESNVKALHRRSQAHEALRHYGAALKDAKALQRLGGGALTQVQLQERIELLKGRIAAEVATNEAESSDDECDLDLVRMKEQFDEVVEKYDLRDGEAAGEVADWITSGEWVVEPKRVASRFKMDVEDAETFLKWIGKGLEFKTQNADAQQAAAQGGASLLG